MLVLRPDDAGGAVSVVSGWGRPPDRRRGVRTAAGEKQMPQTEKKAAFVLMYSFDLRPEQSGCIFLYACIFPAGWHKIPVPRQGRGR